MDYVNFVTYSYCSKETVLSIIFILSRVESGFLKVYVESSRGDYGSDRAESSRVRCFLARFGLSGELPKTVSFSDKFPMKF